MSHRPFHSPLAVAFAGLLVAALCAGTAVAGAAPRAAKDAGGKAETATLTVPLLASSAAVAYQVYAAEKDFYGRYGLKVSTPASDAGQAKAAIVGGSTPLGGLSGTDFLNVAASGVGLKAIGCARSAQPFEVFAQSAIPSAKALKGKTIGTTSLGSAHNVAAAEFLETKGLQPSDVTFVPLGAVPNILAALQAGRVDAGLLSYPFYETAAKTSSLTKLGEAPVPPGLTVVNVSWAKGNRNTILAYLKGVTEGLASYSTDKKAAVPVLAKFLALNLDDPAQAATANEGYRVYLPPATAPIGPCTRADLEVYRPYLTPEQVSILDDKASLLDNSYVDALTTSGFYTGLAKKYGTVPGFPAAATQ